MRRDQQSAPVMQSLRPMHRPPPTHPAKSPLISTLCLGASYTHPYSSDDSCEYRRPHVAHRRGKS